VPREFRSIRPWNILVKKAQNRDSGGVKANQVLMILLFLGVGAYFGFTEYRLARIAVLQVQAESFATTTGRISSGGVDSYAGSKGSVHYYPRFTYTYEAGGKSFRGIRYRYNRSPAFYDFSRANQVVLAHPAGSEVTVYYNPNDPHDTVLSTGVDARNVSSLFMMGGLLGILLWAARRTCREIEWPGAAKPVAGGQRIISQMMTTRVRLPRYEAGSVALLTGAITAFVAGVVVGATVNSPPSGLAPGLVGEISALVMAVITLIVYLGRRMRIASGKDDLVIDEAARTVALPLTYKRKERLTVPFPDITAVVLDKIEHRTRSGVTYTYAPTLQLRNGTTQRLTDLRQARAESLATWLREKLGLPAT